MNYLAWDQKTISDFSGKSVAEMYENGYLFTRIGKGIMQQTRSVRIDLSKFTPNSENRRILKKTSGLELAVVNLPMRESYEWKIGKLAKDFYESKFGPKIMSAGKIKEILTDESKSNFNRLLVYSINENVIGYAICYENSTMFHYSYPFYDLVESGKDTGLGMMIRAIEYAKNSGAKYIYLGSLQRKGDIYKLQFEGLEWFDHSKWQNNSYEVKKILEEDN